MVEQMLSERAIKDVRALLGHRSIVFIGLMGAGKTAIGRRVAQVLALPFIDSDDEIEAASRMSIPDLFDLYGEDEFRSLERRVLLRLLKEPAQVISSGGGAFMNDETRREISSHGYSVWLKADIDLLLERVSRRQNRPLLQGTDPREVMEQLMEVRYPVYANADVTVESRDITKDEMAGAVIDALADLLRQKTSGAKGSSDARG